MATDVTTQPTELRILLADDHAAARVGMRRAIEPHGIRVVAEAANAAEALALAHQVRPHVCVVAVGLPGNGIEAVAAAGLNSFGMSMTNCPNCLKRPAGRSASSPVPR